MADIMIDGAANLSTTHEFVEAGSNEGISRTEYEICRLTNARSMSHGICIYPLCIDLG